MKTSKLSLAISTALAVSTLVGCGGGSSNDPKASDAPVPVTTVAELEGDAMKGTFAAANVSITSLDGNVVSLAGTTLQTDANGAITGLTLTSAPGFSFNSIYKISVTADANSTMVCDAAACGAIVIGEELTGDALTGT